MAIKKKAKAGTSKPSAAQRKALFVEAYCTNGRNATQAAITAGYSRKTARQQGARLLTDVNISAAVARRSKEALAKAEQLTDLTAAEVMRSLARDLRFDPLNLLDDNGGLKKMADIDSDTRLSLRGIEFDEIKIGRGAEATVIGHTVKVKFPEKTAAREQGMKHFGLYEADNEQKPVPVELPAGVKSIRMDFGKVKARARAAGQRA